MVKRIFIYLNEMFPFGHFLATFTYPFLCFIVISRCQLEPWQWQPQYLIAAISQVCFVLLIRVMDEFKDYKDDLQNFPNRPLPSGRVKHSDLRILGMSLFLIPLLITAPYGIMFWGACICLGYSLLMLKWFFIEARMRKSLPLALASHHPIAFLYLGFFMITWTQLGKSLETPTVIFLFSLGFLSTIWEISRKLRLPKQETLYTTYSKIWGLRKAASIVITLQIFLITVYTIYFIKYHQPAAFIFTGISLVFPVLIFQFAFREKEIVNPKKLAEYFAGFFQLWILIDFLLR